jgi:DNA repair exonuclease SbcCD ATPase subunit
MDNKLHDFFSENDFDFHEPHSGHLQRFERRLQGAQPKRRLPWKWMSIAASVLLAIGFFVGQSMQNEEPTLSDMSSKMAEVESYFVNTINFEVREMEKSRSLDTEEVIEKALEKIEKLEDDYKAFIEELSKNGKQERIIHQMIQNYQQRLEILQNTLIQIELIKNQKTFDDEDYS